MITLDNVTFNYGSFSLFKNLKTEFKTGSIYGLLGKNGAGKTTLLKLISGLLSPREGTITVLDKKPLAREPEFLESVYLIPETFYLPALTGKAYVEFYSPFYPSFSAEDFEKHMKELELSDSQVLRTLSYGQKKKFLLAFGLATRTSLLMFDEPTNGLDIPSKRVVRKLLAGAVLDNRTIIISTHQVRDLQNLFDTIVLLDSGWILFNETVQKLSDRLTVKTVQSLTEVSEPVYYEEVPGGFSVLLKNDGKEPGYVDIEFLFNALTSKQQEIRALLA